MNSRSIRKLNDNVALAIKKVHGMVQPWTVSDVMEVPCVPVDSVSDRFDFRRRYALLKTNQQKLLIQAFRMNFRDFASTPQIRIVGMIIDILYNCPLVWLNELEKVDVSRDLESMVLNWTILVFADSWDKELKFHSNYFFCDAMGLSRPDMIDTIHSPGFLWPGRLGRKIDRFCLKTEKSTVKGFLWTVLNGIKKGMPHVSRERIEENAVKHKKRLQCRCESPSLLRDEVTRTSQEIWRGGVIFEQIAPFQKVSLRACLEAPRSFGGALGALRANWDSDVLRFDPCLPFLVEMREEVDRISLWTSRGRKRIDEEWIDEGGYCLKRFRSHRIETLYADFDLISAYHDNFIRPEGRLPRNSKTHQSRPRDDCCSWGPGLAEVKFILEPLKVRTITKQSLWNNAIHVSLQRKLLDNLQKFPCFKLTGSVVSEKIIHDLWSNDLLERFLWRSKDRSGPDGTPQFYWKSSDFAQSTDNLHLDLTIAALKGLTCDPEVYEFLKFNLCDQEVSYPDNDYWKNPDLESFQQANGQLMGSLYSFPILCCINAAIIRHAMEVEYGIKISLRDLPALINGDDLLFPSDNSLELNWSSIAKSAGLPESPGKSFSSPDFCMINSRYFKVNGVPSSTLGEHFEVMQIPYLNYSFFSGVRKGVETDERTDLETYRERCFALKGAFRDSNIEYLPERIANRWRSYILQRNDVRDSKFSCLDLGLPVSADDPWDPVEYRKIRFWHHMRKSSVKSMARPLNSAKLERTENFERQKSDLHIPNFWKAWRDYRLDDGDLFDRNRRYLAEKLHSGKFSWEKFCGTGQFRGWTTDAHEFLNARAIPFDPSEIRFRDLELDYRWFRPFDPVALCERVVAEPHGLTNSTSPANKFSGMEVTKVFGC